MISINPEKALDAWQRLDRKIGLVQPWYTHPALDVIQAQDLSDKTVLEWGGGCSTLWWAKRAKRVFTIEAHREWWEWITGQLAKRNINNAFVECRWPEPLEGYLAMPEGYRFDIVCIDGSERTNCLKKALTLPKPLTIICDNWQQYGVYVDEEAEKFMAPHPGVVFPQPGYQAQGGGNPWQTAIWHIKE